MEIEIWLVASQSQIWIHVGHDAVVLPRGRSSNLGSGDVAGEYCLALQLHSTIHTVIIIEHRECGAYKAFLEPAGYGSAAAEKAAHKAQADKLEKIIMGYFPSLAVVKWLASLTPPGVGPLMLAPAATNAGLRMDRL